MSHTLPGIAALRSKLEPPDVAGGRMRDDRAPRQSTRTPHVIIATINPEIGDTGVQTHTRALRDGLIEAGIACDVETPFARPAFWLPVFALRKLFGPFNRSWSTRWYRHWHAAALRQALARRIKDAVIRNGAAPAALAQCPVSAAVALDVRERLGLSFPVVMACHFNFSEAREYREKGELPSDPSYQAMLDFEQRILASVDRVIYVSAWARRIVEQERGIAVRHASVIWNGISASGASAIPRGEIGLLPANLVLINVGTLEKRKNQLGLIDLFAQIAQERPDARLVLVGDGPLRAEVRKRIMDRGLTSKVRMLGMRHDVPALLASADLYIHYADMENCPVVLIEAARAGLPVAAVPGGGVPELLEALGGTALNSADIASSLNALRPLLTDSAARRRAGDAAREGFERSFTREAMIAAYLDALRISQSSEREVSA